jgi:hypothetical protein
METGFSIQQQVNDLNREWPLNFGTAIDLSYRERVTQGPAKMDHSPRSIYQLQRRNRCSSRGYRSMVPQGEHPRLENLWLLVMDSWKT